MYNLPFLLTILQSALLFLIEQIKAETNIEISKLSEFNVNQQSAALDLIENFCRHKAVQLAVVECAKRIGNNQTEGIEKIVKDAVLTSLQRDLGLNYWENPRERLLRMKDSISYLKSGWESVDYLLYGGFTWGELNYFVAPTGGGKSVSLQNLSINMAMQGYNVLYITFELKQDLVGKRFDALNIGVPLRNIGEDGLS